jgi:hypothetical protein
VLALPLLTLYGIVPAFADRRWVGVRELRQPRDCLTANKASVEAALCCASPNRWGAHLGREVLNKRLARSGHLRHARFPAVEPQLPVAVRSDSPRRSFYRRAPRHLQREES